MSAGNTPIKSAFWGNVERMYPIRTEKSFRLDDNEINFKSDKFRDCFYYLTFENNCYKITCDIPS